MERIDELQAALEQYKVKVSDLGNLGQRQGTMTTYYVSIVSALFGVLAFKGRSLGQVDAVVVLAITVPGTLVSLLWFLGISFFRSLFRAKLRMVERIEELLPFQTFRDEFDDMRRRGPSRWLWVEQFVPLVFAAAFLFVAFARFVG